jgi:hypothetical protein
MAEVAELGPLVRVSFAVHDSRANIELTEWVNVAHFGDRADELAALLTKEAGWFTWRAVFGSPTGLAATVSGAARST